MTAISPLSTHALGVLSVHIDGERCRVGCEFCYLGARQPNASPSPLSPPLLEDLLGRLEYEEVAVALSEPAAAARPALEAIIRAAKRRERPVAITTTLSIAAKEPDLFARVSRVNLSVDPRKGWVDPERIGSLADQLHSGRAGLDVVLIVSLTTPEFAARLIDGELLSQLVDLPAVGKVALNALKPPPPWCDRAFWMHALARLRPLLARALETRLFLDCYVSARLLGLGGCPARPDVSPGSGGVAFRSCVYQPAPDFTAANAVEIAERLRDFTPPSRCPFQIL
jgi:hypothetical protein